MNYTDKLSFLREQLPKNLRSLDPQTKSKWGKMNVQQMIEHLSDSVREANGKTPREIISTPERLPAMKDFLMSDKEFKPETKNIMMGSEPLPVRHGSMEEAIMKLEDELKDFENKYEKKPDSVITNPFFGHLNFEEWIQLLHKHAIHHLKQFGVSV